MRRVIAVLKGVKRFFDELGYLYTPKGWAEHLTSKDK